MHMNRHTLGTCTRHAQYPRVRCPTFPVLHQLPPPPPAEGSHGGWHGGGGGRGAGGRGRHGGGRSAGGGARGGAFGGGELPAGLLPLTSGEVAAALPAGTPPHVCERAQALMSVPSAPSGHNPRMCQP